MKYCKWCNKETNSKKREYCDEECEEKYFEMSNIVIPTLWGKRITTLNKKEQEEEIQKFAKYHELKVEFLKKKLYQKNYINFV